jgi:hypothetical protein
MPNRLGYCCINLTLNGKYTTNRSMRKATFESKGLDYVSEITLKNVKDILPILEWNRLNGIFVYRMSSCIVPWQDRINLEDLKDYKEIATTLKIAGDFDFAIRLALVSKGRMVAKNLGYYLNSQKGLSTKPNRLQNIEKDQICFRYGIFDKIEKKNLQHLLSFEVKNLLYNKKFRPINNFIKKYNQFVEKRIMDREFFLNRSFLYKSFFKKTVF